MRGSSRLQFLLLHLCPSLAQHSGDNSTFIPNACIPIHSSTHIHVRHSAKSSSGVEGTEMKRASFINEEEPSFLSSFLPCHIFASIPRLRSIKPRLIPAAAEGGREAVSNVKSPGKKLSPSVAIFIIHLAAWRPPSSSPCCVSRFSSYFHMHSRALCLSEARLIMTGLFTLCKKLVLSRTYIRIFLVLDFVL